MKTSRPHRSLSPLEKQAIREQAVKDHRRGLSATDIAAEHGVSRQIVHRWIRKAEENGKRSLRAKKVGRPSLLTDAQTSRLCQILVEGSIEHGFSSQLWTLGRIAKVVEREFGVKYHPRSLSPLLRRIGFSCQKPEKRARERDEEAIQGWLREEWPRIKKKGAQGS